MTELDYALEIIEAMKPIHAEAMTKKENIAFWKAVEKLGNQAQEVLEIGRIRCDL